MPRPQLEEAIARLAELGAIAIDEGAAASPGGAVASRMPRPPSGVRPPSSTTSASIALASGEESLDEAVDLGPDRRKSVLETFEKLDRIDHYALLGIPNTADKTEVRNAYFALSKVMHPDSMFGKQLGSYKAKMETIFRRATEAYETLSKQRRRDEYDASIGLPPLERRLAERPNAAPPAPEKPADPGRISSVRPRPPVEVQGSGPDSTEARFPRPSARAPAPAVTPSAPMAAPPEPPKPPAPVRDRESGEGRRPGADSGRTHVAPRAPGSGTDSARAAAQQRILNQIAQRTGRPATPFPPPKSDRAPGAPATGPGVPERSRDSILRGLAGSLRDAGRVTGDGRVDKLLRAATSAEQSGDVANAVNLLRAARDAYPDRADIAAEYRRVRFVLAQAQADAYESQARREEKMEMWSAAAISWSRVAEGRPDSAIAHRRAAHCMLASNGDLKRARDLAQRAVDLAAEDVQSRIVLGRVYIAAGMKLNARRELEVAAKLDPKDEFVKNLLRETKP